jgi:hypothetical protein
MLNRIKKGGTRQGEFDKRINQPPILWVRFFGWLASGVCLGWLARDWIRFANVGAIRVLMITAIISQFSIVIYSLLQSKLRIISLSEWIRGTIHPAI